MEHKSNTISIIDYGMGNIGSLENMIRRLGYESVCVSSSVGILEARKLILPGVGSFDNAIKKLNGLGLIDSLQRQVIERETPILCICLGAQLITKESEEGSLQGMGWIDARVVRFDNSKCDHLKIPHMGWNAVFQTKASRLFDNMHSEPRFYFVHSYYIECSDKEDILSTTHYGYEFTSAVERGNIYATQFHPEKSHKFGTRLIQNFMEL